MFIDSNLVFSSAQTFNSIGTGTAASTNIIDLQNAREMSVGDTPGVKLVVYNSTAAATSTGSGTLNIQFQGSTTTNGTWTTYAESAAIPVANIGASALIWSIHVPRRVAGVAMPRYLQLNYTVGTATISTGALTAFLTIGKDENLSSSEYAAGYSVGS